MPFKKVTVDGVYLAPNFVDSPTFQLTEKNHARAPIDGWEWISQKDYDLLEEEQSARKPATPCPG